AHADAAVGLERDEPERGQPAERLTDGRPRHPEPLRQLLLAEDRAGLELAGDDRLLDQDGDVVGLGALDRHGNRSYADTVRKSCSGTVSATAAKTSFAPCDASTAAISSRTSDSVKRP